MKSRERVVRAIRFQKPDRPPISHAILPSAQYHYGEALKEITDEVPEGIGSWTFELYPAGENSTRLISRVRFRIGRRPLILFLFPLIDIPSFLMERRMLLSIKERAEALPAEVKIKGLENFFWFLSLVVAFIGILVILFSKKWPWTLLIALVGVTLMEIIIFMIPPSPVIGALLIILILAAIFWINWQRQRKI